MSNGEDDTDDAEPAGALDPDDLETRLDDAAEALENAETESDLDAIETTLDAIAEDLEAADLPEPDDEDEEGPQEAMESRLSDLQDDLEEQRGPYVSDVTDIVDDVASTVRDTRWTEDGEPAVVDAATAFAESVSETLDTSMSVETDDTEVVADELESISQIVGETDLDPDEDAETIAELLDAAETLADGIDDAEEWDDLTVREQLQAQGFYDVLDSENRKDFPAEWNAVKLYTQAKDVEPILTALDRFESDFMEENILDALEQIAPEAAFDAMHERAQKRNIQPIRILGRIGDDRACETLHDFLGGGDVKLEKTTLRALGAIGSEESTQPVANRLVADNAEIRSLAARSLGLIGDTRAIEPLGRVLEEDDADEVRASAAWALNQIGTEAALDAAAEYVDDRSYIVQVEAEKATGA
ncbi:HEAT repeat domain-containing protein [Salinibaculum salinum]|uniref:HEAT repeat domain-containing protein n=1 Tax=Salinibaculum salinum TaxID=3131996 RepID=UPI0030EF484B